jgi:hypothetical protein
LGYNLFFGKGWLMNYDDIITDWRLRSACLLANEFGDVVLRVSD